MQRTWIWETYYKDDEDRKGYWLAGAAALRKINVQVLEDIEDFLLIKGFNLNGRMLSEDQINTLINRDLMEKRGRERMELGPNAEKEETFVDPYETGQEVDKKRNFITKIRPHERCWNFIEDDEESKVPHVLRAAADPNRAYIDGRIRDLLFIMEGMGAHLRMHNSESWEHLNKMTMAIF